MSAADASVLVETDFDAYFGALWDGATPFGWQRDLVSFLVQNRRWPQQIDLPTGTGKSSVVDIAVFVLALGAAESAADQWHPRRIALVVDRRVIVDQADLRASRIAARLDQATDGVLRTVADRLRGLAVGPDGQLPRVPIAHTVLRGGIVRDESWAYRPDLPAILSSTVDQVGSRLLFRGYGVSRGMRPVHAGLLANDVLYLLDEVHLARPFAETLHQVASYRAAVGKNDRLPNRWGVVQLSATPGYDDDDRFPTEPLDGSDSPVLERRLTARKPVELVSVAVPASPEAARERLAQECRRRATALIEVGARTVAVIVNRVDTALRVRTQLEGFTVKGVAVEAVLITGRMRPVDRSAVLDAVVPRVALGRDRSPQDLPLVLIATQSIEAGADFDVDAAVTECASLDALRQRFGRVDRDGQLSASGSPFTSVILAGSSSLAAGADDPVYGTALQETWRWLSTLQTVDFGIRQLPVPTDHDLLEPLLPLPQRAPVLLPSHLDRWVQTSEYGVSADPDVAHWLHGIDASAQAEDVSLVWRDDLDRDLFRVAASSEELRTEITGRVDVCPPVSTEALAVPLSALRQWLAADDDVPEVADVVLQSPPAEFRRRGRSEVVVIRWRDDRAELIGVDRIEPGDTVVVPSLTGGLRHGTWCPADSQPVPDVHDDAVPQSSVFRLSLAWLNRASPTTSEALTLPDPDLLTDLPSSDRREAVVAFLQDWLDRQPDSPDAARVRALVSGWRSSTRLLAFAERVDRDAVRRSFVILERAAGGRGALADEDRRDGTSFGGAPVTLADHLVGVERWARQLAGNLGFDTAVAEEIARAGRWHDLGKLDPRFQQWLHGGDAWRVAGAQGPLAKSMVTLDPNSRALAQRRSGYRRGLRHELLSVGLLPAAETDLVRHLVASHHGRARYRFGPQPEVDERAVRLTLGSTEIDGLTRYDLDRLDGGVADRFWSQVRQWGWFGLAWLEGVVRLADHEDSRVRSGLPEAGQL